MAQNQKIRDLTPEETLAMQQSATQDQQRALQEGVPSDQRAVQQGVQPHYPTWPTSVPGPWSTPVPPGMKPINALRREQVAEIAYNQEAGEPGLPGRSPEVTASGPTQSYDQPEATPRQTGQEKLGKRKKRL